ncbi:MAG: hypothetical protein U1F53_17035 [Burkholderiaceae bacterium]
MARHAWAALTAGPERAAPEWLPFDHPLWIVYSSGTTGLPKPIVHGHGGVVLEALKGGTLHNNGSALAMRRALLLAVPTGWISVEQPGRRPAGRRHHLPLRRLAGVLRRHGRLVASVALRRALVRCTFFAPARPSTPAAPKVEVEPQALAIDLVQRRGLDWSPLLADDAYRWTWRAPPQVEGRHLDRLHLGRHRLRRRLRRRPAHAARGGRRCSRCLGAKVEAWSEPDAQGAGCALMDEVGELVCTAPMPSMPLYLWGDADGQRLRDSYFDNYPGVWRHGDWIRLVPREQATGAIIYGRSDATINRHGVRMGTAELYRAVEAEPEVVDSLVVDLEYLGRESYMPLFVVLREGAVLDEALRRRLVAGIRQALSPRHVPSEILAVPAIPRTLSGKKMELPVKKLLLGADPAKVMNRDAMANAASVDWFVGFAARRAAQAGG